MSAGPVVFDLAALQSTGDRHRGIARYVTEHALAVHAAAPGLVGALTIDPGLAMPEPLDRLAATGALRPRDEVDWAEVGLFHVGSPFERPGVLERVLPAAVGERRIPRVVTYYDLIPLLMPGDYLEDPGFRRRYRARVQLVRTADAVLTLSEATRRDSVTHLRLDPARVVVIGAGTATAFVPPDDRTATARAAAAAVAGLSRPYVFYAGSYERRKNLDGLLAAWARLGPDVRERWQLVITCPLQPLERNHLDHVAEGLGLGTEVVLTGYVPDEVLLALYQGTDLFVYPSLYEGYGLPVAEALACGAPVVAADASSLPEIVGPESLFDPHDPAAIAAAVTAGLTDGRRRERLLGAAGRPPTTWAEVAERTVAVYDRLLAARRSASPPPRQRPPRLGFATAGSRDGPLTAELGRRCELHRFAVGPAAGDVHSLASLPAVEALCGPFDGFVFSLAADADHAGCLAAFLRHGGIVLAHDVRLGALYAAAVASGALAGSLTELFGDVYRGAVPDNLGAGESLTEEAAGRAGVLMLRHVAARATRLLVTSEDAAAVARLEVAPADRDKVTVVPSDPAVAAAELLDLIDPIVSAPLGARSSGQGHDPRLFGSVPHRNWRAERAPGA
ncbi:MAG: glycosyltransferase family 4 protein [Acidimicrobiia bacterium]